MTSDQHPILKSISNVGSSHLIVHKISPALYDQLHACFGSKKYNCIDVVRIGYSGSQNDPVVVWIGVDPDSLQPREGLDIALACRRVIQNAGLDDVHCEIREATVQSLATSVTPHQQSNDRTSLTSVLGGQSVASETTPNREGTLSLYVSLGEGERQIKCALVSRHVLFREDEDALHYQHGGQGKYVIMPGQTTFDEIRKEEKRNLEFWQQKKGAEHKTYLDASERLNEHLASLQTTASRRIGYVLFSPPRVPRKGPGIEGDWLPDYALVKLDRERFGPDYDTLSNKLCVGDLSDDEKRKINPGQPRPLWKPASKHIDLRGTFEPGPVDDDKPHYVGQRGRTSGLV